MKNLCLMLCFAFGVTFSAHSQISIIADAAAPGKTLTHYWSLCVGAGRANEGLRAGWQEQLQAVHEACGFRYVRFHGLFHDDMFVVEPGRNPGDPVRYNWQYIDDLFDRMLAMNVRPFVELSFFPKALAGGDRTQFWWKANVTPPKDLTPWKTLVDAFLRHCIARYGAAEVRTWYFEVWNEPDLRAFWDGTKSQYFEFYAATAQTVKAVDPALRVGGPATSNFVADGRYDGETEDKSKAVEIKNPEKSELLPWRPVWVEAFLTYCAAHQLPVDFVSCHPYPADFAIDQGGKRLGLTRQVDATRNDLTLLRKIVSTSAYPKAEIHLTEWSTSPSPRDRTHDSLPAATYIVRANLEAAGLVDSLSYWTFTDVFEEGGAGDTIFHGGFGLINYQGIVKPAFHAYRFLNALGDEQLAQSPGAIVTRHSDSGLITALAWHYPPEMPLTPPNAGSSREKADATQALGKPASLSVELTGLAPNTGFRIETLDATHGNALSAWDALGRPEPPTRAQIADLKKAALATLQESVRTDSSGKLSIHRTIQPWSIVLIDEQPKSKP